MTTEELIKALRCNVSQEECKICPFTDEDPEIFCHSDDLHIMAANKLEDLQRFIDDMLGDHYVDYLEFYTNRCRELEEELKRLKNQS